MLSGQHSVLDFLESLWSAKACEVFLEEQQELRPLKSRFEEISDNSQTQKAMRTVSAWRILASNSLRNGNPETLAAWDRANQRMARALVAVTTEAPVTIAYAAELNAILEGETQEGVRSVPRDFPLYGGDGEYLPHELIASQLAKWQSRLSGTSQQPLLDACVTYVGFVTIHPFPGANGRTARLLADHVLLHHGWLPLCFASPVEAHVAFTQGSRPRTIAEIYRTFFRGLKQAYRQAILAAEGGQVSAKSFDV